MYKYYYQTPKAFSNIIMTSDGTNLTRLWFECSKDILKYTLNCEEKVLPIFEETCQWLDIYFSGHNPSFTPKYKLDNQTNFQKEVTNILNTINYGKIKTYQDVANIIASKKNIKKMSAQAVGGAVGANPICLIIPCHRVVGKNGNLTGYGGGLNNKIELLKLEGVDMTKYFIPKKGKKNAKM